MADSPKAAREHLASVLTTNDAPKTTLATAGVARVVGFEPGAIDENTVAIATVGMTEDNYRCEIRVYRPFLDLDMSTAQDQLDQMITAVDTALYSSAIISTPTWTVDYIVDPAQLWVAVASVEIPREDTHYS